jgi:SAM-dependent methyltransferase
VFARFCRPRSPKIPALTSYSAAVSDSPVVHRPTWTPGRRTWFRQHDDDAATQILTFVSDACVPLAEKAAADIGCGDGILDLRIVHRGRPAKLAGFDIVPTKHRVPLDQARRYGLAEALPPELEFAASGETARQPTTAAFDVVCSWSAFEHIGEPRALLLRYAGSSSLTACFPPVLAFLPLRAWLPFVGLVPRALPPTDAIGRGHHHQDAYGAARTTPAGLNTCSMSSGRLTVKAGRKRTRLRRSKIHPLSLFFEWDAGRR